MNARYALGLVTVLCAAPAASVFAQVDAPEWRPVWRDEFDAPTLDLARWRVEDAALVKNNEKQYYSPANVAVKDGRLVITAERRENGGRAYTSGLIDTRWKSDRAFGRFEARIRVPRGRGMWPAFWMLPADGSWPPEIDILEVLGHEPQRAYVSNHFGVLPDRRHRTSEFTGPDLSAGFHDFRCDWLPDRINFYIDEKLVSSHTEGVPQAPMYVILNLAVGGDWPGDPDATTEFPQTMEVDWVRVWEPVEKGKAYIAPAAEHGRVQLDPSRFVFPVGQTVSARAIPNLGYRLVGWEGTAAEGAVPEIRIHLEGNTSVRAIFEPDPSGPVLLSRGRPARASSIEAEPFKADFAVDGSRTRRWSSKFSEPQWIMVDLEAAHALRAVRLEWEGACATEYVVESSLDGSDWTPLQRVTDGRPGERIIRTEGPLQARYVRVTCVRRATRWGCSLWELEVFGDP